MALAMEFWGVEVKAGQVVKVDQKDLCGATLHLSQIALCEAKKGIASEPVVVYLKVGDQKFVVGTLSRVDIPQISLDLYLHMEFELSHNSKNASVNFCGYKVENDDDLVSDFSDTDEDLPQLNIDNGKAEKKAEKTKIIESKKPLVSVGASTKQVKIVDPKKDEEHESDEEDGSSDEMDADSDSNEESESDEDDEEETPAKKVDQGKKRPDESASKTPVPTKKAKNATPEKTDGKKSVHTATPHPMKKVAKTSNSVGKDQTPKSGGQLSFKSRNKSFTSKNGLEQHKKAKRGGSLHNPKHLVLCSVSLSW